MNPDGKKQVLQERKTCHNWSNLLLLTQSVSIRDGIMPHGGDG